MLSDSFGLPKGVKNRTQVLNWLKLLGFEQFIPVVRDGTAE